ncbi:choice-of-anchor J domain-containing protein [Aequorivita sp. SDUM287046]|uniref:Choice-of-anchor J domain-containing protein n=1 Tax=Aequorivita aurantiaca TaxID=3053356 RepID=A0ABT8DHA6_9FLAO|nr:choice-of-anchor J domain-containing protein [Aequorivita aurantiaca]MDN3724348.1 choice-of-anchor J domain-containing protein [Aequorivita aurantiaca]
MKKITLLAALFAGFAMNAQLFSDDFEDQDISDWTLLDEDGDGFNFRAYDPSIAQNGERNYMSSESWDPIVGPLTPDNYAISPAIDVAGNGTLQLDYLVGGQDPLYFDEIYTVYVSTGNTIADFENTDPTVTVSFTENIGNDPAAAGELVPRNLDLSSLDGATTLYIAFRHHDVTDQFIINFDDVVLTGVLSVEDNALAGFNYFVSNNQLNLSANTALENVALYNMLGQQVVSQKLSNNTETVELSGLQSGIYIATVSIDGASKSFKIVKN